MRAGLYLRSAIITKAGDKMDPIIVGQLRKLMRYVEIKEIVVAGVYTDQGKSGATLMRPELQRLLSDAKEGKFEVVLAEDISRISRNFMDCCILEQELQKSGVQLEYLTPTARLVTDMMSLTHKYYEHARSEAIRESMRKRSKKLKRPIAGKQRSLLAAKS